MKHNFDVSGFHPVHIISIPLQAHVLYANYTRPILLYAKGVAIPDYFLLPDL